MPQGPEFADFNSLISVHSHLVRQIFVDALIALVKEHGIGSSTGY